MGKTRGTGEGGIRCFGSPCTTKCGVVGTWHFATVSLGTTHWLVLLCTAERFCWQQYETQSGGQKKRGQSPAGHLAEQEELLAKRKKRGGIGVSILISHIFWNSVFLVPDKGTGLTRKTLCCPDRQTSRQLTVSNFNRLICHPSYFSSRSCLHYYRPSSSYAQHRHFRKTVILCWLWRS